MFFTETSPSSRLNQSKLTLGQLVWYKKGKKFSLVKPGIWQIYQGIIQLGKMREDEQELFLGWGFSDTAFSIGLQDIQLYQCKALSDVYLRWFPWDNLETFPQLNMILLPQLSRRLEHIKEFIAITKLSRVEDRLFELLLLLKAEIGKPQEQGTLLPVRFTHESFATAIGVSRVSITKELRSLQEQGLIQVTPQRQIWIQD